MRKLELGLAAVLFLIAIPLCAQDSLRKSSILSGGTYGVPVGRTFLPHNWIRGFTEMEVAPSHNEPDLGRCAGPAADFGGIHAPCTDYARYMLSGYIEIQPIGRTALRHIFVFYVPRFSFGRNVPQFSYTGDFSPIAYERTVGVGVELPRNFELRIVEHKVDWLGQYDKPISAGDLGTTGPYGLYATAGLRWYFGGYGRTHGSY